MNIYKSPNSDLNSDQEGDPQFVKFYVLGTMYALSMTFIISAVIGLFAIQMFGYNISNVAELEAIYSDSRLLVIDLVVTIACLYFSGYVAAKYLVQNYIYHGGVLGIIVLVFVVLLLVSTDGYDDLPFWYNFLSFAIIVPSVALGSFKRKV
ncbi:hypothetical protein ACFL17_00960 [Pseudomonadota bacterium]